MPKNYTILSESEYYAQVQLLREKERNTRPRNTEKSSTSRAENETQQDIEDVELDSLSQDTSAMYDHDDTTTDVLEQTTDDRMRRNYRQSRGRDSSHRKALNKGSNVKQLLANKNFSVIDKGDGLGPQVKWYN
jgi:predicted DNA binding CopG/RHH family protein